MFGRADQRKSDLYPAGPRGERPDLDSAAGQGKPRPRAACAAALFQGSARCAGAAL